MNCATPRALGQFSVSRPENEAALNAGAFGYQAVLSFQGVVYRARGSRTTDASLSSEPCAISYAIPQVITWHDVASRGHANASREHQKLA